MLAGRPLTIENTKGLWPDPEVNYEKCCAEVNAVVSAIKKPPFVKVQELYALKFYNALAGKVQLKTFNGSKLQEELQVSVKFLHPNGPWTLLMTAMLVYVLMLSCFFYFNLSLSVAFLYFHYR